MKGLDVVAPKRIRMEVAPTSMIQLSSGDSCQHLQLAKNGIGHSEFIPSGHADCRIGVIRHQSVRKWLSTVVQTWDASEYASFRPAEPPGTRTLRCFELLFFLCITAAPFQRRCRPKGIGPLGNIRIAKVDRDHRLFNACATIGRY